MTNEEILAKLHNEICEVTFEKRDGTERTMICTLKEEFLPYVSSVKPSEDRHENDYIPVFDLEERAWRAFKPSKLISIESSEE
jgi:hypothetical protein